MMRGLILSVSLMMAPCALAQTDTAADRPDTPAPTAVAPFEQRESWCEQYANWFIASTPPETAQPSDVNDTHRFEVEFNSCKTDPSAYERDTRAELELNAEAEQG